MLNFIFQVAVYKRFWIRFGNKVFDLNNLDDYEKHFTVNNYNENFLLQVSIHILNYLLNNYFLFIFISAGKPLSHNA